MKSLRCPNWQCSLSGKSAVGHIIRYGFYTTKVGKRRRYQCQICGKTFCSTCGTPYYRLQHRRATFDGVASLSVEGMNSSRQAPCLEHGPSLAGKSSRLVSSVQPSQSKGTLDPGASGRRDPNDHWGQGTGDLGFRRDRRLVAALAIDDAGQTKLSQHAGPVSRPFQPNES